MKFERLLVVSDMDGTMLNHMDYEYEAVIPILEKLQVMQIPLILNTSKTFAELRDWVTTLDIQHPFIVENGSAIFIPYGYFPQHILEDDQLDGVSYPGYQVLINGTTIDTLQAFLQQQRPAAIDFSACSLEQAMALTGLNEQQARDAQNRQFSIPLSFQQQAEQQEFARRAVESGFSVLRGGRFLHLLGHTDKGSSMQRLKQLYESCYQADYGVVALGDSPNDKAMLEQSDLAVIVKSPSSDLFKVTGIKCIRTRQQAPQGWVEGVLTALNFLDGK